MARIIVSKVGKSGSNIQTFSDITGYNIEDRSYLRMMDVLKDGNTTTYFMNVFKYYDMEFHDRNYTEYEVGHEEWWDNISYTFYGTPFLWWLVALSNDVINPFEELVEGTNIRILSLNKVYEVISSLDNIRKL